MQVIFFIETVKMFDSISLHEYFIYIRDTLRHFLKSYFPKRIFIACFRRKELYQSRECCIFDLKCTVYLTTILVLKMYIICKRVKLNIKYNILTLTQNKLGENLRIPNILFLIVCTGKIRI